MNTTQRPPGVAIGLVLVLITAVSILIAGCGARIHPSFASSPPSTPTLTTLTPTPDLFDPLRYEKQEIAQMRERLQDPHLEPRSRQALERNLEIIEGDVRMMETAWAITPDPNAPTNTPRTPVPTSRPRPTGILERFNHPPIYPNDVSFTSGWQDQVDGKWIQAYTGVRDNNPTQGFVYVKGEGEYPTPTQVGAVTITAYEGTVLTLTSADGTTFRFDVATGTFLSE